MHLSGVQCINSRLGRVHQKLTYGNCQSRTSYRIDAVLSLTNSNKRWKNAHRYLLTACDLLATLKSHMHQKQLTRLTDSHRQSFSHQHRKRNAELSQLVLAEIFRLWSWNKWTAEAAAWSTTDIDMQSKFTTMTSILKINAKFMYNLSKLFSKTY